MKFFLKRPTPWYQKKGSIVLGVFVVALIALRIALPGILKKVLNEKLATSSKYVGGAVGDVDLFIIRGAVGVNDLRLWPKDTHRAFLSVRDVDVSLAWRQLFRGRVMLEAELEHLELDYTRKLLGTLKKVAAEFPAEKDKKKLPLDFERLEVVDSHVNLLDYPGLKAGEHAFLSAINAEVLNLTPTETDPFTRFDLRTNVQGLTAVSVRGKANLRARPIEWDADSMFRDLDLTALNEVLKEKLPLTFKQGHLDFYAEAKSEDGRVEGYMKPFFEDLKFVGNKSDFKGAKHWFFEIGGALGNFILRNDKVDSVATKIPFTYEGRLKIDGGKALDEAIEHGFEQRLKPGIENKLQLMR